MLPQDVQDLHRYFAFFTRGQLNLTNGTDRAEAFRKKGNEVERQKRLSAVHVC